MIDGADDLLSLLKEFKDSAVKAQQMEGVIVKDNARINATTKEQLIERGTNKQNGAQTDEAAEVRRQVTAFRDGKGGMSDEAVMQYVDDILERTLKI